MTLWNLVKYHSIELYHSPDTRFSLSLWHHVPALLPTSENVPCENTFQKHNRYAFSTSALCYSLHNMGNPSEMLCSANHSVMSISSLVYHMVFPGKIYCFYLNKWSSYDSRNMTHDWRDNLMLSHYNKHEDVELWRKYLHTSLWSLGDRHFYPFMSYGHFNLVAVVTACVDSPVYFYPWLT